MKFDHDLCLNLRYDLNKLLKLNSTLRSIVPLAMFSVMYFRPGEKTTAELFKDVDLPDLEELIKLYKEDFDIHGYDPYKYLMS